MPLIRVMAPLLAKLPTFTERDGLTFSWSVLWSQLNW